MTTAATAMTSGHTSLITYLTGQHRSVALKFGQLEKLRDSSDEEAATIAQQAVIALMKHSVAEEIHLYPLVRERLGDELADREIAEHNEAERTMKDLEGLQPGDTEFWPTVHRLIDLVRQHVHEEEFWLFPRLQRACSREELLELGRKIAKTERTAPTRPHPTTPHEPGALEMLGPGAGMIDRLRDALTGRGR